MQNFCILNFKMMAFGMVIFNNYKKNVKRISIFFGTWESRQGRETRHPHQK